VTADITPDGIPTYEFTADFMHGERNEQGEASVTGSTDASAFLGSATPLLGIEWVGQEAGEYEVAFSIFADTAVFSSSQAEAAFYSTAGTVTVTSWYEAENSWYADGTFDVQYENNGAADPITLHAAGEFGNILMVAE